MKLFSQNRVAILMNSLLVHAGVERRTLEFARFLLQRGYSVDIFVLRKIGPLEAELGAMGAGVHDVRVYDYSKNGTYRLSAAGLLRLLAATWRGRFGLIFCVQPPSSLFGRVVLFPPLGRKIVAMERFSTCGRSVRRRFAERILSLWTTKIVCVSSLLRDELLTEAGIPRHKIEVVENGVEPETAHSRLPNLRNRLAGKFVFGCVGTLESRKRQWLILDALTKIREATGRVPFLVLVGRGDAEASLRSRAHALGLTDYVHFAGETTHPHDYYPLFHAFLFPSAEEGFGSAWAEAMSHGLPVICTNIRPMSDYVRHDQNGLLFPKDDSSRLAEAMMEVMNNPALGYRLGNAARVYAAETFNRDRQLAKLLAAATGSRVEGILSSRPESRTQS